ncbi:helix-turn-helix domain-containing protein [Aureibacter tunicatorum]|uniref:AraC-like DNA-binding protein n=1 Tax=Aureibacter tunicatorum TaxID=866807 RepID=A0AAE3XS66_9BACT|nr:helix-turn-helix transcriptional regulator [Aureibacter tunicatorum]MDR6241049.1 AraC-like DNA-binding protein [Aureibacter tunicatorum]BDD03827.1 hypothetical protein AUTU_13100 [Aureibacter tunicatorum]
MRFEITFINVLNIISCVVALNLGGIFILGSSENKKGNVFLGLFLWSLANEVFINIGEVVEPKIEVFFLSSMFTIPFLVVYVNRTINNPMKLWEYFIFLPGILLNALYYSPFSKSELFFDCASLFEYAFNLILLGYVLIALRMHKKKLSEFYSDLELKTLKWIKMIVFIFILFHVYWILEDVIGVISEWEMVVFAQVSSIFTFFMIIWIAHFGFEQIEIFKKKTFDLGVQLDGSFESILSEPFSEEAKLKEEKVSHEISDKYLEVIDEIETKKLYLNPKLTLRVLAELLSINERELSRLINTHSQGNFYQLINRYRIDEFKRLMNKSENNHLTILGMAQESGFNSKSTFYTAFKNLEGMTPKEYESSLKRSE